MSRRPRSTSADITRLHRSWLTLVDTDGPFLSIPEIKRVWPQGAPPRTKDERESLAIAHRDFEAAWERFDRLASEPTAEELTSYRNVRDEWVQFVLRDAANWGANLEWAPAAQFAVSSPTESVTVTPSAVLRRNDDLLALVVTIDPTDSLRTAAGDGWAASHIDRAEAMLRKHNIPIGIVTDGRWWALVCARTGAMAASGIVDALDWRSTAGRAAADAFLGLIGRRHLLGDVADEQLPVLFENSVAAAEEITEALGTQVRQAVELLIQAFSEAAAERINHGEGDPLPENTHEIYEAAVTVMMRVVFLLFAEERGLLPAGDLFEQAYGISREFDRLQTAEQEHGEEGLDSTTFTWHRLLATSQALYSGVSFEGLRMPAYGGSLFDPSRFEFLSATTPHGSLAITVPDLVMLHVLRSVQTAEISGERRRVSFRDIDVEQIGYIYEGLLGYTCGRADDIVIGILGSPGDEPEVPLTQLEAIADKHADPAAQAKAINEWVKKHQPSATPKTASALAKALKQEPDKDLESALSRAVAGDDGLRRRVHRFLPLTRPDLRRRPMLIVKGGLIVKETPSRRNAGAHYTPKSLAEEVVLHALEPICYSPGPYQTPERSEWKLKSSSELLSLKVADIACGSGAFLVAAGRYLADRVTEAWTHEGESTDPAELQLRAMREVVANCLYGADINEMAVEMCKLSLWLVSLDRNQPFSFVDDKIFCGNSLLGLTDLKQLRSLHIDPTQRANSQISWLYEADVEPIVQRAIELRRQLGGDIVEDDPVRGAKAKARLLNEFKTVTDDLRTIADGVIAAGLRAGSKPGKQLNESYDLLSEAVKKAFPETGDSDRALLNSIIDTGLTPTVDTDYQRWEPLHWAIEAPDVIIEHGGFDAIIGNPPFLGGQKLTGAMGTQIREWFVHVLAGGKTGSADLAAYFFLRAGDLASASGTLGLIATNTIGQGATREVGLESLIEAGAVITRAIQSRRWPSASANLEYAAVWCTFVRPSERAQLVCDDHTVSKISALLEAVGRAEGNPAMLGASTGLAFQGSIPLGKGFVVESEQAARWIEADPRNEEVLFPYVNGEDVTQRPDCSASRHVIFFSDRTLEAASSYREPFAHLERFVLPERCESNDVRARQWWWQFLRPRNDLYRRISQMREVISITLVSKTLMPARLGTDQIFANTLGIFATDSYADQAVLSSSAHQMWAIKYGSTLESRVRYTPSDVFETYPRPESTDWLHQIGRGLDEERREMMLRRELGLTDLYNLVNDSALASTTDPDIIRMREIHIELDQAVMDAYGWSDIELRHGFHTYRQTERWTVCPEARVEILDRLLEENHRRAALEADAAPPKKSASKSKKSDANQPGLFS